MITNGYDDSDLVDAPDNGWLGHYSLTQQGKTEHLDMKFEDFIKENGPVTFTDPIVSNVNGTFVGQKSMHQGFRICFV